MAPRRQGQNRRAPKKIRRRNRAAVRDVRLMQQPQLSAINQAQLQAQQDYLAALQGGRSAWGGFQNRLGNIPEFPQQQIGDIYGQQIAGLSSLLSGQPAGVPTNIMGQPVGLPQTETGAGNDLFGALGAGTYGLLANDASRAAQFQQSAARQGNLSQVYNQQNLGQQLSDLLQGYGQQRLDVAAQTPLLIKQRMDELQQQALANRLAQSGLQSDKAFRQMLISNVKGYQTREQRRERRRHSNKEK